MDYRYLGSITPTTLGWVLADGTRWRRRRHLGPQRIGYIAVVTCRPYIPQSSWRRKFCSPMRGCCRRSSVARHRGPGTPKASAQAGAKLVESPPQAFDNVAGLAATSRHWRRPSHPLSATSKIAVCVLSMSRRLSWSTPTTERRDAVKHVPRIIRTDLLADSACYVMPGARPAWSWSAWPARSANSRGSSKGSAGAGLCANDGAGYGRASAALRPRAPSSLMCS